MINAASTMVHAAFSETCSCTNSPFSIVAIDLLIYTNHDAINVLIIVQNIIATAKMTAEVSHPCTALVA